MTGELLPLLVLVLVGAVLGSVNAAGLWWTTRRLVGSRHPALLLLLASLLRLVVTVAPLVLLAGPSLERLLIGLAGFLVARHLTVRTIALRARDGERAVDPEGAR